MTKVQSLALVDLGAATSMTLGIPGGALEALFIIDHRDEPARA